MPLQSSSVKARQTYSVMAYNIMRRVYRECRRAGFDDDRTVATIAYAYPWGKREGHRYKAWLQARKRFLTQHKLPGVRPSRAALDIELDTDNAINT